MTTRTRVAVALPVLVALGVVVVIVWSAWSFYQRARQVRTFADMQTICKKIDSAIGEGVRSQAELLSLLKAVNHGKDAWGADYVLVLRADPPHLDYVLISKSSDGRLDSPSTTAYFALTGADVHRQFARDIVFRNGSAVTLAGK